MAVKSVENLDKEGPHLLDIEEQVRLKRLDVINDTQAKRKLIAQKKKTQSVVKKIKNKIKELEKEIESSLDFILNQSNQLKITVNNETVSTSQYNEDIFSVIDDVLAGYAPIDEPEVSEKETKEAEESEETEADE